MSGVVVIGAGLGIGGSVARRFAREGLPVGLIARRKETLDPVAAGVTALGTPVSLAAADAGKPDELTDALSAIRWELGIPDAVVYNAGLIRADVPGELTPQEQTDAWSVNVLGALTAAVATMPLMRERGSGTFLVTGGMPVPDSAYVSLSLGKAGARALTSMLAQNYGPQGVHAATITVAGAVESGTPFDPDVIAEHYWRLHAQPRDSWDTEYLFDGS